MDRSTQHQANFTFDDIPSWEIIETPDFVSLVGSGSEHQMTFVCRDRERATELKGHIERLTENCTIQKLDSDITSEDDSDITSEDA